MTCTRLLAATACLTSFLGFAPNAAAHFGAIIPSDDIISRQETKNLQLSLKFLHPMEGQYMELAKPKQFGVLSDGTKTDLLPALTSVTAKGRRSETRLHRLENAIPDQAPRRLHFLHGTDPVLGTGRRCVHRPLHQGLRQRPWSGAGLGHPLGLETEIIPKTRPYGLWTGNVFTGQVLVKGKPAADVEVEIEYLNESGDNPKTVLPPSDPFITQVIKTDADGLFTYAMPRAGWWGFAALSTADRTIKKDGIDKPVEIGAVYWVHTTDMQ
jgi:cobalt/nickel transport protein